MACVGVGVAFLPLPIADLVNTFHHVGGQQLAVEVSEGPGFADGLARAVFKGEDSLAVGGVGVDRVGEEAT